MKYLIFVNLRFSSINKKVKHTLGDKGVKISGGQKQRVGLARSLYGINEILILDEPTSSLEHNLEKNNFKNFKIFCNKYHNITHKEIIAKKFNKILIFKNKKLINLINK